MEQRSEKFGDFGPSRKRKKKLLRTAGKVKFLSLLRKLFIVPRRFTVT